jgi:hypothetical protein
MKCESFYATVRLMLYLAASRLSGLKLPRKTSLLDITNLKANALQQRSELLR